VEKLPTRFVLSIRPQEYLKQGLSHCGVYSVKAILSAYGRDLKKRPEDYHTSWFERLTGIALTRQYVANILQKNGLSTTVETARELSDEGKLNTLKQILSSNTPVLLSIGNGYRSDGSYNPIRARIIGHFITLWGYDDKKQVFYVYDSCVPKDRYDKTSPIGNTKRTYPQIIRDWKTALSIRLLGGQDCAYIKIHR